MSEALQQIIDAAWENRASISPANAPKEIADAVESVISDLNKGRKRVAEKINGEWVTHQWLKKAVLLSFRLQDNAIIKAGDLAFYDKVQTKFAHLTAEQVGATGVRVVPPAVARRGSYLAKNVILMPAFDDFGACADEAVVLDDGRVRLQWFQHAADADAA